MNTTSEGNMLNRIVVLLQTVLLLLGYASPFLLPWAESIGSWSDSLTVTKLCMDAQWITYSFPWTYLLFFSLIAPGDQRCISHAQILAPTLVSWLVLDYIWSVKQLVVQKKTLTDGWIFRRDDVLRKVFDVDLFKKLNMQCKAGSKQYNFTKPCL